jgi:hypothetical protein
MPPIGLLPQWELQRTGRLLSTCLFGLAFLFPTDLSGIRFEQSSAIVVLLRTHAKLQCTGTELHRSRRIRFAVRANVWRIGDALGHSHETQYETKNTQPACLDIGSRFRPLDFSMHRRRTIAASARVRGRYDGKSTDDQIRRSQPDLSESGAGRLGVRSCRWISGSRQATSSASNVSSPESDALSLIALFRSGRGNAPFSETEKAESFL